MPAKKQLILITGPSHSGTSAMAGALRACGIPFGKTEMAPTSHNPKGYVEIPQVSDLNERLLVAHGSKWNDTFPITVENWWHNNLTQMLLVAMTDLISKQFSSSSPIIGIKDPRICRLLPLWLQVAHELHRQPSCVFMLRSPGEVAASISEWHPQYGDRLTFLKNWKLCAKEFLRYRHLMPSLVVPFHRLITHPEATLESVIEHLDFDIEISERAFDWLDSDLPTKREGPTDDEATQLYERLSNNHDRTP